MMGCYESLIYLLEKGADPNRVNARGHVPLEEALISYKEWHNRIDATEKGKDKYPQIITALLQAKAFNKSNTAVNNRIVDYVRENKLENLYTLFAIPFVKEKIICPPIPPGAGGVACQRVPAHLSY